MQRVTCSREPLRGAQAHTDTVLGLCKAGSPPLTWSQALGANPGPAEFLNPLPAQPTRTGQADTWLLLPREGEETSADP